MRVCASVCVCASVWCLCLLLRPSDQAGLQVCVGAAAQSGAPQQQVLLVDQAVQQVLLPVVVVHLEEG